MFGLRHRWTYLLRTLPDTAPFLEPLERAIADLMFNVYIFKSVNIIISSSIITYVSIKQ